MKHPDREAWVPFLYGDADPETTKHLAEHLKACPECADELNGWRRSLHRLDAWTLPRRTRRRMPALNPMLNLAAAAVLVLGLGLGFGRWFPTAARENQVRSGLESSLKASLLPELRQQVQQELAGEWQARFDRLQQESNDALAKVKAEAIDASTAEFTQAGQQLLALIRSQRADDQQALAASLDGVRKEHQTDFVSLRKDLETVATTTDDRIRAAQLKLIQLTSFNPNSDSQH